MLSVQARTVWYLQTVHMTYGSKHSDHKHKYKYFKLVVEYQHKHQVTSNKCIAVRKVATPLRELTCHLGSHSVTCHPAEVTFPPLPQPKLVLD